MRRVTQSWLLQYRGQILSATPVPKLAISCCPIPSSVSTTNTLLFLYQIYQYEKLAFAKRRHLKGLESDSKMATMYCKPSHHRQQITWRKESYDAVWQHKRLYQWQEIGEECRTVIPTISRDCWKLGIKHKGKPHFLPAKKLQDRLEESQVNKSQSQFTPYLTLHLQKISTWLKRKKKFWLWLAWNCMWNCGEVL